MNTFQQNSKALRQKKNAAHSPAPEQARAEMPAPKSVMLPFSGFDELVNIAGIDFTTERALNVVGISKFSNFSGYTPETLAEKLASTGVEITAATIAEQDWIGRAAQLAAETPAVAAAETAEEQITTPAVENKPAEPQPVSKPIAKPQSAPAAVERGGSRKPAPAEMKNKRPAPPENVTESEKREAIALPEKSNAAKPNLALVIQEVSFTQFETQLKLNRPAVKMLRGEIHCALHGAKALLATIDGTPLCAQVHAMNELTGEHILLASQFEALLPAQASYPLQLEFAVPQRGRYQLQVVAFLLNADPKIALRPGPLLRVEL